MATALGSTITTRDIEKSLERDAKDPEYMKLYAAAVRQADALEASASN